MAGKFVGTISNCAVYICRNGFNRARMVRVLPTRRFGPTKVGLYAFRKDSTAFGLPDEIGGNPLNPFFI